MTDTSKHTPGKWTADGWTIHAENAARHDGNSNGAICVIVTGGEDAWEEVANARLIAAAPDLLEALKGLVKDCPTSELLEQRLATGRAAIAKAEGKSEDSKQPFNPFGQQVDFQP